MGKNAEETIIEIRQKNGSKLSDHAVSRIEKMLGTSVKEKVSNYNGTWYKYVASVGQYRKAASASLRLKLIGYRVLTYKKSFERSPDCRRKFLSAHPDSEFVCVYCGRRVKKSEMEVDHLVPVRVSQRSATGRRWLRKLGCDGVNDAANLVPSCKKCNRRKGDKMGIWMVRGWWGRTERGRAVKRIVKALLFVLIIALLIALGLLFTKCVSPR